LPEHDLDLLIQAARRAGDVAMGYFRKEFDVWDKPGEGPVTAADIAVNDLLEDILRSARPDYGWMSEESPVDAAPRDVSFIVDPIDGTRAFIDGTSAFSHALAVVENGQPVAAVVFLPAQDKLYLASTGAGATLNGAPIRASSRSRQLLATKKTMVPEHWPGGVPEARRSFRPSLAYRMCLVAEGRFDAMVTFRPAWEWDIVAGTLIAQEAGALVTDAKGADMTFNAGARKQDGCVAAAADVHGELMARAGAA